MSQVCDTLDPNLKFAKFELEVISTNGDSQRLLKKQSKYKLPPRIYFQNILWWRLYRNANSQCRYTYLLNINELKWINKQTELGNFRFPPWQFVKCENLIFQISRNLCQLLKCPIRYQFYNFQEGCHRDQKELCLKWIGHISLKMLFWSFKRDNFIWYCL